MKSGAEWDYSWFTAEDVRASSQTAYCNALPFTVFLLITT